LSDQAVPCLEGRSYRMVCEDIVIVRWVIRFN